MTRFSRNSRSSHCKHQAMHGGCSNNQWEGRVMNTKPAQNGCLQCHFSPKFFPARKLPLKNDGNGKTILNSFGSFPFGCWPIFSAYVKFAGCNFSWGDVFPDVPISRRSLETPTGSHDQRKKNERMLEKTRKSAL